MTRKEILSGLWEALFIVLTLVGIILVSPFILIVGVFGFVIIVGARIWSRLSLEDVLYERDLPDHAVFVGDDFDIEIRITNAKPLPMPWLRVADTIPIGLEVQDARMARANSRAALELRESINLAWYERVHMRYTVKALRRGYHQPGPATLDSGDLFGMFPKNGVVAQPRDGVLVYPRTVELPDFELPSGRPIGDNRAVMALWEDPNRPRGLRDYIPGDPIKTIDWKVTARLRQVLIRTFDPSVTQYAVVVMDVSTTKYLFTGYSPRLLERAITGAGSIATHAMKLGHRVGLVTNGVALRQGTHMVIPPSASPGQLGAIMEALAMIRPVSPERIDRLLEREANWAIPYGATVVIVSAVMSPDLLEVAERLAIAGHPVRGIYVGMNEAPEGTACVPIEDMGTRFHLPIPPAPRPTVGDAFDDDFNDVDEILEDVELERGEASFERWRI
ncbi:MAG TPA: DUF58 domain-containing protein [Dehalococcoidia bacterium]|nr:hypothetical protein [Chloroflexota bacterium]MDP5877092.1 DUF58 domain-containing protein [Dehalococcoidia bacterium]MDP6272597.1 DUF58 domain-containing protein [Dehalococcoidia bacterium]MDP7161089.1 DUF58 domain-containing protein [Dehalococcoidia bacterium]MDP7214001.1 DUF58 domain-containing protein [Dehalococcoidia bacterium]